MGELKTPTYVRKAQKKYYENLKSNPEKYKDYLEKRRNYLKKWRKNRGTCPPEPPETTS